MCSLGLCPLTPTQDVQGCGMSLHCKHRLLTRSLDVPPWREGQLLCPGLRGHCWKWCWLCKGTAGTAPPWTLPHFCCSLLFSSPGCCVGNILDSKQEGDGRFQALHWGDALAGWKCCCRAQLCPSSAHGLSLPAVPGQSHSRTGTELREPWGLKQAQGL